MNSKDKERILQMIERATEYLEEQKLISVYCELLEIRSIVNK